jgi:chaperonin GroES
MLHLETKLVLDAKVASAANLTDRFSEADLAQIGEWVWNGYAMDQDSRNDWLRRNQAGMDLALQLQKDKAFPWPGSSNVAFPLVTIAAMQFHSRAYPTLISGTQIVKCRVPAPDPTGEAKRRALRVGQYMSYQVLEEDQSWEEQHDRLLLQIPIIGCAFVKTRYDSAAGHNVSELVPAVSLVMDYYAKSVESCGRKTHIIPYYRNEVYEKVMSGAWADILDEAWYAEPAMPLRTPGEEEADKRKGIHPGFSDEATPLTFLEQHCSMDFDGDGYAEPYTVLVEGNSKRVVRITARWDRPEDIERTPSGKVIRIRATEAFTKYGLIPSPDGSVYDMGFGVLLGPLNESVNSLVNQLIDAGTLSNAAGGFLSRGVKIRGGAYNFQPFGWQRVDSTGDDLRKGVVPLPVREPSAVLFQLLSFLVNYTQRVSGSTDMTQGENPGQNTPAATSQAMIEQGMKIYSALFKRVWRCMKEEFCKLYILNTKYMPAKKSFGVGGTIGREDFLGDPSQVVPVADPNITSDGMRLQQALVIAERAQAIPGYNREAVERNLLEAMKVEGVDALFPGPDKAPPLPNPKVMIEQAKLASKEKIAQGQLQFDAMTFVAEMQAEQQLNEAKIVQLMAQSEFLAAQADSIEKGHALEMVNAMLGAAKLRDESIRGHIQLAIAHIQAQAAIKKAENAPASAK